MKGLLLLLSTLLLMSPIVEGREVLFEEGFNSSLNAARWRWPSGQTSGNWKVRGGNLVIRELPKGPNPAADLFSPKIEFKGGGADFTAEMRIHGIQTRDQIVSGERDPWTGKTKPPYPREGDATIALWMIPKPAAGGFQIRSAFSIGVKAEHRADPAKDRHPFAIEIKYYVREAGDWRARYRYVDISENTSELLLRIEKRGKRYRWLVNGSERFQTTEAIQNPNGWLPAIQAHRDYGGGPKLSAKIDYLTVVGEAPDSASASSAPSSSSGSSSGPIPKEVRDAAMFSAIIGGLGALLMALSNLGESLGGLGNRAAEAEAGEASPAREPPRDPEIERRQLEEHAAEIETQAEACWRRAAPLVETGTSEPAALENRLDDLANQANQIAEQSTDCWQRIADLEAELESTEEGMNRAVALTQHSRDELLDQAYADYDQVDFLVDPDKLEEVIRNQDEEGLKRLKSSAHLQGLLESVREDSIPRWRAELETLRARGYEVYDLPYRGMSGEVVHDSREWQERCERYLVEAEQKQRQLEKLIDGGYAALFKRVAQVCDSIAKQEQARDRELLRVGRALGEAQSEFEALKASEQNLQAAEQQAGQALDRVRNVPPEVANLMQLRSRQQHAISVYQQYVAQGALGSPRTLAKAHQLLEQARQAGLALCAASAQAQGASPEEEAAAPAEAYPGYQDDLAYLDGQRQALNHQQQALRSYMSHHPPGSPHHDPKTVMGMRARLRDLKNLVRDQEERIRASGGRAPLDTGPDQYRDPYAGVGAQVGLDWKNMLDERAWQDHLSAKVNTFMDRHPEYNRLRDNLYNADGSVNIDILNELRQHHIKESYLGRMSSEERESLDNWFANGAYYTARELFTGVTADGETTWGSWALSMGFKGLSTVGLGMTAPLGGVLSAGVFEGVSSGVEFMFHLEDGLGKDKSLLKAINDALGNMALDEVVGRGFNYGLGRGINLLTESYPGLSKDIKGVLGELYGKLDRPLNAKPVDLTPELEIKKTKMLGAIAHSDHDEIIDLYRKGGMKDLGALEAGGHIDAETAKQLNAVLREHTQEAIMSGTKNTVNSFEAKTGVRIEKLTMGDSGSSSLSGVKQSVQTDFDRTNVLQFNDADLELFADKNGLSPDQARNQLAELFTKDQQVDIGDELRHVGLTNDDVGYASYNGFGAGAGQDDAYSKAYTYFRQARGTGLEFKIGPDGRVLSDAKGGIAHYRVGGQSVIDANELTTGQYPESYDADPMRYSWSDWEMTVKQQKIAGTQYNDVKHLAKAVDRATEAAVKMGKGLGDPRLEAIATQIRKNPEEALNILTANDLDESSFVNSAKGLIANYQPPKLPDLL